MITKLNVVSGDVIYASDFEIIGRKRSKCVYYSAYHVKYILITK